MDLSEMLIQIRGKKGDSIAQSYTNNKRCEQLYLQIESLSMSLQMEFNRIQGSSLHKLQTHQIGNNIKEIIEDGINAIIDKVFSNERLYKPYLDYLYEEIQKYFPDKAKQVFCEVSELHLKYNFDQIVWKIKNFDYQTVIRMLECLIVGYVFRRYERRKIMPGGCYN